jgi:ribose transport system permease protein
MVTSSKTNDGGQEGDRSRTGLTRADLINRYGLILAWLALIAVFSILLPDTFFTIVNFTSIFGGQAVLLVLTLGLVVSLTANEIDLSIAGVMSVSLVLLGYLNVEAGWPILLAVAAAFMVGILVGIIHAILIVGVQLESIVVTLGTGTLLYGVGFGINYETTSGISQSLVDISRSLVLGIPLVFYYALALTVFLWYVYRYTPLGRYLYVVGANRDVARLSGLRVAAIRSGALITTSAISAVAGILLAGQLGSADPNTAEAYLLPAFAAAFLGSTAITPGRFNAWGAFVAVYFLITGITGLNLLGFSGWIESFFYGGSLVVAVTFSKLAGRKSTWT